MCGVCVCASYAYLLNTVNVAYLLCIRKIKIHSIGNCLTKFLFIIGNWEQYILSPSL